MKKPAFAVVATLALLAPTIANVQTPATSHMAVHQMPGSHGERRGEHRSPAVVGIPILGAASINYFGYSTPDAHSTLEGFYPLGRLENDPLLRVAL